MSMLDRCLESLAFCHLQDEAQWPSARLVAQQVIDEFISEVGPEPADKQKALTELMAEFARRFPDESDPVLIRSTMRRHLRRIGFDLQGGRESDESTPEVSEITDTPAAAPELASKESKKTGSDC